MNRWDCDAHGCKSSAVGCGGAIGLRALGWYFAPGVGMFDGPTILCPAHRPDPEPCTQEGNRANAGKPCSVCVGERDANRLQEIIRRAP